MGDFSVTAKLKVNLTGEDIDEIMCTALECGITYWCCEAKVIGGEYHGEWASDEISRGGQLKLYDAESDDAWILTRNKFLNGVRLWLEKGLDKDGAYHDGKIDTGMIDAIDADNIVQLALFGEVVFG